MQEQFTTKEEKRSVVESARGSFGLTAMVNKYKRLKAKVFNRFDAQSAEVIILVGTEKGSTAKFAALVYEQLMADGVRVYMADMKKYEVYGAAKQLICMCSTYGDGKSPKSASGFKKRLNVYEQPNDVGFSVLGFGSSAYSKYCAYAIKTDRRLAQCGWARQLVPLHKVNKRSVDDFVRWAQAWTTASGYALRTDGEFYRKQLCKKK